MSACAEVVVSVGAVPPGHRTAVGHVGILVPVASCVSISVKLPAVPDCGGLAKVKAQLPVKVMLKVLPEVRSMVYDVPELAVTTVSP